MNSYKNDICYILIFCLDLNYYITFQKSKCTVVPGTQTKPWIVFGALFEFYTTCDFQISQTWSKY